MSFIVDLRIDIRSKEMLNISPCKKRCNSLVYFLMIGDPKRHSKSKHSFNTCYFKQLFPNNNSLGPQPEIAFIRQLSNIITSYVRKTQLINK